MEWLTVVLTVLAVPFVIGYFVGKSSSSKPSSDVDSLRIQGQREVRDYLIDFLKHQPKTVQKSVLLKEMGAGDEEVSSSPRKTSSQPVAAMSHQITTPKTREQRDIENTNLVLYVASFLIVAAAVLFIGTNVNDALKFLGAWAVAIGFYIVGLSLHIFSERLKPAAVAFVGTGLAILPFAGIATNVYILHDPYTSWWITSIIGVIAFFVATIRLRSQVLAYFTLAFVFSLTTSTGATLQTPLVWSYVAVIVIASLLNLAALLKPRGRLEVFSQPIDTSSQLAVPLAVFGSWLTAYSLPVWQHATILLVTTLHYALSALNPMNSNYRYLYAFIARWTGLSALTLFAYDISNNNLEIATATFIFVVILLHIVSSWRMKLAKNSYEEFWIWASPILLALSFVGWVNSEQRAELTAVSLLIAILSSIFAAGYLKRSRYGVPALLLVVAFVLQVSYDLISPSLENYIVSLIFIIMSSVALVVRALWWKTGERINVSASACVVYGTVALLTAISVPAEWQIVIFVSLAMIAAAASYVEKEPNFFILTYILIFFAGLSGVALLNKPDDTAYFLIAAWVSSAVYYAARVYFIGNGDKTRGTISALFTLGTLIIIGFMYVFDTHTVEAAFTLLAGSALLAIESILLKQRIFREIALIIATLALQRLVAHFYDVDMLVYTHWWAVIFAGIAFLHYSRGEKDSATGIFVGALLFMSIPSGLAALSDPTTYQLLFLLEHVALLTFGALTSFRLATIWGAIGIALAVLYWLQGFTFLLVGLLGIGLIVFAIVRLLKSSK